MVYCVTACAYEVHAYETLHNVDGLCNSAAYISNPLIAFLLGDRLILLVLPDLYILEWFTSLVQKWCQPCCVLSDLKVERGQWK